MLVVTMFTMCLVWFKRTGNFGVSDCRLVAAMASAYIACSNFKPLCWLSIALTVNPHIHHMKQLNTDIAAVGH